MKRCALAVAGLCGLELAAWTWFRLRRPKPVPFRPDWLDAEVAKLHSSSCEQPDICTPEAPVCGTCRRARSQFHLRGPSEALTWESLAEWQRESWRQEVAA